MHGIYPLSVLVTTQLLLLILRISRKESRRSSEKRIHFGRGGSRAASSPRWCMRLTPRKPSFSPSTGRPVRVLPTRPCFTHASVFYPRVRVLPDAVLMVRYHDQVQHDYILRCHDQLQHDYMMRYHDQVQHDYMSFLSVLGT